MLETDDLLLRYKYAWCPILRKWFLEFLCLMPLQAQWYGSYNGGAITFLKLAKELVGLKMKHLYSRVSATADVWLKQNPGHILYVDR